MQYLFNQKNENPRLIWWILILQDFDLEVSDRKRTKKQVENHLSRLDIHAHVADDSLSIHEEFQSKQ